MGTDELQAQVTRYWLLTLLYAGTIVTSGLADFVYIKRGHRSFYGKIDFVYAHVCSSFRTTTSAYERGHSRPAWSAALRCWPSYSQAPPNPSNSGSFDTPSGTGSRAPSARTGP